MIAIDTNILVYAHRQDSSFYKIAYEKVAALAEGDEPWALAWHSLHEFLAIVTHPRIYTPPTSIEKALTQIEYWVASPTLILLVENEIYFKNLSALLLETHMIGPKIHDLRLAALCNTHQINTIWTADRDFSRINSLKIVNPLMTAKR